MDLPSSIQQQRRRGIRTQSQSVPMLFPRSTTITVVMLWAMSVIFSDHVRQRTGCVRAFVYRTAHIRDFVRSTPKVQKRLPPFDNPGSIEQTISLGLLPEACEPIVQLAQNAVGSYESLLIQHPLPTKSLTAGLLCGISDVIAQNRDASLEEYNPKRTLRFASKGCFGGILWSGWYDWIDGFLDYNVAVSTAAASTIDVVGETTENIASASSIGETSSKVSLYVLTGALLPPETRETVFGFCRNHLGAVTTAWSMVLEQLVWCPLVYGTFEIPVSTLLNGGKPTTIVPEVRSKLNGLLVSNFKVWTPANLIIYNAPLEWRLFLGNCIDIVWQSIVSDVAADCGNGSDEEECALPDEKLDGIRGTATLTAAKGVGSEISYAETSRT